MLNKEQEQAIKDIVEKAFYCNDTVSVTNAIVEAIKVYDEQVNGKTDDRSPNETNELKVDKFTNAIDVVQTLRQSLNLTERQNFNIKRALIHLKLAKKDVWEHTVGEPDTRIEIKAFATENSKTKDIKSVYIKDDGTLCIELSK